MELHGCSSPRAPFLQTYDLRLCWIRCQASVMATERLLLPLNFQRCLKTPHLHRTYQMYPYNHFQ